MSCVWEGDACVSGCAALDTAESCESDRYCFWLECDGQSKPCDEYGSSDCPVVLGCDNDPKRQYF
jgi:hypothetical protein